MAKKNLVGHPLSYKKPIHFKPILEAIPKVLSLNATAKFCKIPQSTFKDWINSGEKDLKLGIKSELAELSAHVRSVQLQEAAELIARIKEMPKSWMALAWLLERCFREDYGQEAGIISEIREEFESLKSQLELQSKKSR